MPLSSTDLVFYYTGQASGPSDNTLSLGGALSNNQITSGLDENVFDDVTGAESESGESHYRAIGLKDTNSTYTYLNYEAWILGYKRAATGADTIYFGLERSTIGGAGTSIQVISDEYTSPNTTYFQTTSTGLAWVVEGSPSETITPVGNTLTPGGEDWVGIWFWRTIPAGAEAYSGRACTLKFRGETTGSPRMVIEKTWCISWRKDGQISVEEISS
jgi:hypothetical protein